MDALIKSLQIIRSYMAEDISFPTNCSHDCLWLYPGKGFNWDAVAAEDQAALDRMGWTWDPSMDGFSSTRYGSN